MALQLSYTTPSGVVAPTAYARITDFAGNKAFVNLTVSIYLDALAAKGSPAIPAVAAVAGVTQGSPAVAAVLPKQPLAVLRLQVPLVDGGTMTQLYDALKSLPQFVGATSV